MKFTSFLFALVASLCVLDSTFALPAPSTASAAQVASGHSQLEKRGWWSRMKKAAKRAATFASSTAGQAIASQARSAVSSNTERGGFLGAMASGVNKLDNAATTASESALGSSLRGLM
jgi:hypothetical protein